MASDWEESDSDSPKAPAAAPKVVPKKKWEGEDEKEEDVASDWEDSSEEEEDDDAKPAPTTAAPPKKKGTLKQKLAEKEAALQAKKAAGDDDDDDDYDSDVVLDPREKARRDKERELNADLSNAADLLGAAALGGTSSKELDALITANPRTKDDYEAFSAQLIDVILARHQDKPLYATFLEMHARALAAPLKDVDVRKVASALTTLANEKQKEQRDKASGKKKTKAAARPILGAAKVANKFDTSNYDEAMDDFGADDFM